MAKNYEQELKELRNEFNDAKNEKVRLETRLEDARSRRKETIQEIKNKGYEPKELPKVIKEKEESLDETIAEIKGYLNPQEDEVFGDDEDEY